MFFAQVGTGGADATTYGPHKYAALLGYVQDVAAICQALGLRQVILVSHSEGAMVALLATIGLG